MQSEYVGVKERLIHEDWRITRQDISEPSEQKPQHVSWERYGMRNAVVMN